MTGRINTGKPHQIATAEWARRRLTGRGQGDRVLDIAGHKTDQHGVIFADGVGLGKTWEALAAAALVLENNSKRNVAGDKRKNVRKQAARVLVVCPPGLVTKWASEIRNRQGFTAHLAKWADGMARRAFVLETLTSAIELRDKTDLQNLDKQYHREKKLEQGIYLCNWNVLQKAGKASKALGAILESKWDAIILDEAHHKRGRNAVERIVNGGERATPTFLLSATPFQLSPKEIHSMCALALAASHKPDYKLLDRQPIKAYVEQLHKHFGGGEKPDPNLKRASEAVLKQLVAKTNPGQGGRHYFVLDAGGAAHPIPDPKTMQEGDLGPCVFEKAILPSEEFEAWYLRRRFDLAGQAAKQGKGSGFVSVQLRQLLSTNGQASRRKGEAPPDSARTGALAEWARRQFERDLNLTAKDGIPRKTVVFTSFVSEASAELAQVLDGAFQAALARVERTPEWKMLDARADRGLQALVHELTQYHDSNPLLKRNRKVGDMLKALAGARNSEAIRWLVPLFGKRRFRELVMEDVKRRLDSLAVVEGEIAAASRATGQAGYGALHRRERRTLLRALAALTQHGAIDTYTGCDDRKERDEAGEGFRSPLSPWVLVASNVGSEGIDLHTYAAHLVHFDIEWNPARMEQREGRADRLNRKLKEPVNVYFALVRNTYDERMFHQLLARQRWHAVLLGTNGKKGQMDMSAEGDNNVRLIESRQYSGLELNLKPAHNRI